MDGKLFRDTEVQDMKKKRSMSIGQKRNVEVLSKDDCFIKEVFEVKRVCADNKLNNKDVVKICKSTSSSCQKNDMKNCKCNTNICIKQTQLGRHSPCAVHEEPTRNNRTKEYITDVTLPVEESDVVKIQQDTKQEKFQKIKSTHLQQLPDLNDISANETTPKELEEFDQVILTFMKDQHIPGASLAIWKDGKKLYTQCYGWASKGFKLHPSNRFRIASITKSFTATAILKLYEENKLKLNDKVFGPKGILPHFSPSIKGDRRVLKITIKHLLQHSGGWDREVVGDAVFWKHIGTALDVPEPVTPHDIIQYIMTQKLQFTPGTKYAYSNLGYLILGRVIEKVSGVTYERFIQNMLKGVNIENVTLGKTRKEDTAQDEVEYFAGPRFTCVDSVFLNEGKVPAPYGGYCMESGDTDGGLVATATNLVRFFNALQGVDGQRLLQPKSFKMMLERPSFGKGSVWYGMGLDISWYKKAWEHSGTLDGATTNLVKDKQGFTWAFLCNYWPENSDYTSLISYALTCVKSWTSIKKVTLPYADVVTLDEKYLVKIKIPEAEFNFYHKCFCSQGYRPFWVNGYEVKSKTYFNGAWFKDSSDFVFDHCILEEHFDTFLTDQKVLNFSLCHVDSYKSYENNGEMRYIAIWVKGSFPEWEVFHKLSFEKMEKTSVFMKEKGFCPTHISVTCINKVEKILALYKKIEFTNYWVKRSFSSEHYQGVFDQQTRYGHLLTYVKPFTVENTRETEQWYPTNLDDSKEDFIPNFITIWINTGPYQFISEHEMSKYRVINDLLFASEGGYFPACIVGYEDEGSHRFGAICIKKVPQKSVKS